MSLQSLMNQDFGDEDSDSPDEDFDPTLDGDSGDEDDLPASIEAQACYDVVAGNALLIVSPPKPPSTHKICHNFVLMATKNYWRSFCLT